MGRCLYLRPICFIAFAIILYNMLFLSMQQLVVNNSVDRKQLSTSSERRILLALSCCGDRQNEATTLIKSAIALSKSPFTIIIFTEEHLILYFTNWISRLSMEIIARVTIKVRYVTYPEDIDNKLWKDLVSKCASFRLFLPSFLSDWDSVIYTNTDVLFLGPIEHVWSQFSNMNSSQFVALAQENESRFIEFYHIYRNMPYYGKYGVNAGVMLMNLTRLRKFAWKENVISIERNFRPKLYMGDQDIINILFSYHPENLHLVGCEFNYRIDHSKNGNRCKSAEKNGVFLLHGNRHVFHNDKHLNFKAVYEAWKQYELGEDLRERFYIPLKNYLLKSMAADKVNTYFLFLKNIEKLVNVN